MNANHNFWWERLPHFLTVVVSLASVTLLSLVTELRPKTGVLATLHVGPYTMAFTQSMTKNITSNSHLYQSNGPSSDD